VALLSPRDSGPQTCRLADGSGTLSAGTADARRAGGGHRWADWLLAWLAVAPGAPAWVRGLRLAAAMIVPLTVGVTVGAPAAGLLVGVGAFVVASTDTGGPYRPRAVTMITATLGVTAAYFLGSVTAAPRWLSALLFVSVLLGSALIGIIGPSVARVSTMVVVAFAIGAFLPSSLAADAGAALALLAGGTWTLGLSLAGWCFDRWRPERRAVSAAIDSCAAFLGELDPAGRDTGSAGPGSREAARQSLAVARQTLQASLPRHGPPTIPEIQWLWALLYASGSLFDAIIAAERRLRAAGKPGYPAGSPGAAAVVTALQAAVAGAAAAVGARRTCARAELLARLRLLTRAISVQLESLGSRASVELEGLDDHFWPRHAAASPPARLTALRTLGEAVQTLIAVLDRSGRKPVWMPPGMSGHQWRAVLGALRHPSTAVLRGAVRQAAAGGVALVIASVFDPAHGAWLVSSAVLVLKPNVSGTLSTAAQRAAATVIGAMIAAGIVTVTSNQATLIAISFAVAALAMAVMPLSYSLGILIITPLSILLTTVLTGSGWLIAVSRAENILIGVVIAVLASRLLFPTWLRTSVPGLVAGTIDAIGRYLALVQRSGREAGAEAQLTHEARSAAETAVASLRAAAGQLGLEPGSGAVAIAGDASTAATRVLDAIITLQLTLDQTGPGQPAGVTGAIIGETGDALRRMRAAIAGREPSVPTAVLAGARQEQGRADALTAPAPTPAITAAAATRAGPGGELPPCLPSPRPALLSAALDQLTDAIADLGSVLGPLSAASLSGPAG
jgi:uncharacterized membrane protein YccC